MAWDGYFSYSGTEIINVSRFEAYANHVSGFRPLYRNDALPYLLEDGPYRDPLLDDAPWTDPDVPESFDFYGLYPLSVDGLENSTRTATTFESLSDGGVPGRLREATRPVVFSVLLVAETVAAASFGLMWLRQALKGNACGSYAYDNCFGGELCFMHGVPQIELPQRGSVAAVLNGGTPTTETEVDIDADGIESLEDTEFDGGDPLTPTPYLLHPTWPFLFTPSKRVDVAECRESNLRSFRKVGFGSGPTVTSKRVNSRGQQLWTVSFTATAGDPWEIGPETPVVTGLLDPTVSNPWPGGVSPTGGAYDSVGYQAPDFDCSEPVLVPATDPLCPQVIPPPSVPSVPLGCFSPPSIWWRRQLIIPKQMVPLWGEVVPKINVHAHENEIRNLRVRFYADPYESGDLADDPCAFCGDIIFSYVPPSSTLTFDGAEQTVYLTNAGGARQRADSLLFKSDGTPFEWPALSCGFAYVVTFDLPKTQTPPVIDLSLFSRVA